MLARIALGTFVAGWIATGSFGQSPNVPFAGKWSGSWTNSNGGSGTGNLELTEDANGNFTGVWDDVKVAGRRVNANTIELRGQTNEASYQVTAAVSNGEMSLRYLAAALGKNTGAYDGRANMLRAGSPATAQRRAFLLSEIANLEDAIAADERFIAANQAAQAGVKGIGEGAAKQGERQNDVQQLVLGLLAKGLSQELASRMAERVGEARARIEANRRLIATFRAELNANPPETPSNPAPKFKID